MAVLTQNQMSVSVDGLIRIKALPATVADAAGTSSLGTSPPVVRAHIGAKDAPTFLTHEIPPFDIEQTFYILGLYTIRWRLSIGNAKFYCIFLESIKRIQILIYRWVRCDEKETHEPVGAIIDRPFVGPFRIWRANTVRPYDKDIKPININLQKRTGSIPEPVLMLYEVI